MRKLLLGVILTLFIYIPAAFMYLALACALFVNPAEDLGDGFYFYIGNRTISNNNFNVSSIVDSYCFDDRFILVRQEPVYQYFPDKSKIQKKEERLLYYWIIDKANDGYYGPLSIERYAELKDSLKITLLLDDRLSH